MFQSVPAPPFPIQLQWSYRALAQSSRCDVRWIGPVHGLETHHTGVTKPCHSALTGGSLACPYCEVKLPKRWRGYAPAVSFNAERVVFLVGLTTGQFLADVKLGAYLTFSRGKGETVPVVANVYAGMTTQAANPKFSPGGCYGDPVDLWPWLMRLWGDVALTEVFEETRKKGAKSRE